MTCGEMCKITEAVLLNFNYRADLFVLDREAADAHSLRMPRFGRGNSR